MQITIDTNQPLSDEDRRILSRLLGDPPVHPSGATQPEASATELKVVQPDPDQEPFDALLDRAVARATQFLKNTKIENRREIVVNALNKVGATKGVSSLQTPDQVQAFLAEIGE